MRCGTKKRQRIATPSVPPVFFCSTRLERTNDVIRATNDIDVRSFVVCAWCRCEGQRVPYADSHSTTISHNTYASKFCTDYASYSPDYSFSFSLCAISGNMMSKYDVS